MSIPGGKATADAGSLGRATFKVLDGFAGETRVELVSAAYGRVVGFGPGGAFAFIGGAPPSPEPTPDFDGDVAVGFPYFLAFAQNFGKAQGDADFDPKFYLDIDVQVSFSDFLSTSASIAKTVIGLGLVIFIHELGHFLAEKDCGVK